MPPYCSPLIAPSNCTSNVAATPMERGGSIRALPRTNPLLSRYSKFGSEQLGIAANGERSRSWTWINPLMCARRTSAGNICSPLALVTEPARISRWVVKVRASLLPFSASTFASPSTTRAIACATSVDPAINSSCRRLYSRKAASTAGDCANTSSTMRKSSALSIVRCSAARRVTVSTSWAFEAWNSTPKTRSAEFRSLRILRGRYATVRPSFLRTAIVRARSSVAGETTAEAAGAVMADPFLQVRAGA